MNKPISVIIVDDIKNHQEVLQKKIERYCPDLQVVSLCSNVEEAEEAIIKHKPEIVFLDIELGNKTGFDFLKNVDDSFKVIFVSGKPTQDNLLRAFKFRAYGFVPKPVDKDELILAVHKVLRESESESTAQHKSAQPATETIILSNREEGERQFKIEDIIFCESENTKVHFRFADNKSFTVTGLLTAYEQLLYPFGFYRVQRSYLINIHFVERVLRKEKDIIMQHYPKREIGASRDKELWKRFISAWEAKAIKPE
jgi:two-component system LytT family response regulator